MSEHLPDIAALKREWLAARIVLIGGFTLAIAAGAYAGIVWRGKVLQARQQAAAAIAQEQAATAAEQANAGAGAQLCRTALANAQNFGIVPAFAKLVQANPAETKTTGRYLCAAATDSSRFTVAADLVCRDLKNPQCVPLYSVTQNGGAVLYQRHD